MRSLRLRPSHSYWRLGKQELADCPRSWYSSPLPIASEATGANILLEIIGHVVKAGSKVTSVKVGQRVGVGAQIDSCRDCDACKSENENYCPEWKGKSFFISHWYSLCSCLDFRHLWISVRRRHPRAGRILFSYPCSRALRLSHPRETPD
jgi:hypothetical protein